jgi:hypothetical protein
MFHFISDDAYFTTPLYAAKCAALRCNTVVDIGLPYCPEHTAVYLNLKMAPSLIKGAGTGLFAHCPQIPPHIPVFRKGYYIYPYYGEDVTDDEMSMRYGSCTAPYALTADRRWGYAGTIDAAAWRGIMSMVNHRPKGKKANIRFVGGRRLDGGVNMEVGPFMLNVSCIPVKAKNAEQRRRAQTPLRRACGHNRSG